MYSIVLMVAMTGSADVPAGVFSHGCNGCNGCAGCCGCTGTVSCTGCGGCQGNSCCGCGGGHFLGKLFHHGCGGCSGCAGYTSCAGCTGGCVGSAPAAAPEQIPAPKDKEKAVSLETRPANIQVSLPADAKLFIGDQATTSKAANRLFVTLPLEVGRTFTYSVRAEVVRDGRTITEVKQVDIIPGETTKVSFGGLGNATAGNPSLFAIEP